MNPRPLLHVLSVLLLLPSQVLAALFLLVGHAIAGGGLLSFFGALIEEFVWLVPWGVLGFMAGTLALLGLGFGARTLWLAGFCVGLLASGALVVLLLWPGRPVGGDDLLFLLPCAIALALGFWICLAERGLVPGARPDSIPAQP